MSSIGRITKRILVVTYLVILHVMAAFFLWQVIFPSGAMSLGNRPEAVIAPGPSSQVPTPLPVPSVFSDQMDDASTINTNTAQPNSNVALPQPGPGLIIPVLGVKPENLTDSYSDARSEGRVHDAIDIMAPAGTPVVAAADGTIQRFFDSERGGITIYELSQDQKFMFYYAHLQSRAPTIKEGDVVKKGTTIGFVGDTGNAGPGNYHLHFAISVITDPKHFWNGTPINPYPLLLSGKTPN